MARQVPRSRKDQLDFIRPARRPKVNQNRQGERRPERRNIGCGRAAKCAADNVARACDHDRRLPQTAGVRRRPYLASGLSGMRRRIPWWRAFCCLRVSHLAGRRSGVVSMACLCAAREACAGRWRRIVVRAARGRRWLRASPSRRVAKRGSFSAQTREGPLRRVEKPGSASSRMRCSGRVRGVRPTSSESPISPPHGLR